MLEALDLTRRFSGISGVNNVSFTVSAGEILGYLLLVGLVIAFAAAIAWRRSIERRQGLELVFEEQPEGDQELGLQALW